MDIMSVESLSGILTGPWPWYVAGPVIGAMVPLMLLLGSRSFGISQNLEHICAITQPGLIRVSFFKYDWRIAMWSLIFALGTVGGGYVGGVIFANSNPIQLSPATFDMLVQWGLRPGPALNPPELFTITPFTGAVLVLGGVLIGFGTRYASGCTSGHAITGLSTLQKQSLLAVLGIFSGGLVGSYFIVPWLWSV